MGASFVFHFVFNGGWNDIFFGDEFSIFASSGENVILSTVTRRFQIRCIY